MRASRKARNPVQQAAPAELTTPQKDETGMSSDVLEFVTALDEFKRQNRRPFPTWSEVLVVLKSIGYRKSA